MAVDYYSRACNCNDYGCGIVGNFFFGAVFANYFRGTVFGKALSGLAELKK